MLCWRHELKSNARQEPKHKTRQEKGKARAGARAKARARPQPKSAPGHTPVPRARHSLNGITWRLTAHGCCAIFGRTVPSKVCPKRNNKGLRKCGLNPLVLFSLPPAQIFSLNPLLNFSLNPLRAVRGARGAPGGARGAPPKPQTLETLKASWGVKSQLGEWGKSVCCAGAMN